MHQFANLPALDRGPLFEEAAARMNLADPVVAEKDFWVCWTLSRLYSIPDMPRLLFKGGTSLSKCFGVIHRFSEDIDLGVERDDLGLTDAQDPSKHSSRKQRQRAVKALAVKVQGYVHDGLLPKLQQDFGEQLDEGFRLRLGETGGESDLFFEYPQALEAAAYIEGAYVAPVVKLELGARSDHRPSNSQRNSDRLPVTKTQRVPTGARLTSASIWPILPRSQFANHEQPCLSSPKTSSSASIWPLARSRSGPTLNSPAPWA